MISPVLIIEYMLLSFAAICDVKYRKIYNGITIGLLVNSLFSPYDILQRMAAFFIIVIFMIPLAMKCKSIKGGDIKYISAIGAFFGINRLSEVLLVSVVFGYLFCFIRSEKSFPLAFIAFVSIITIKFTEVFIL